MQKFNKAWMKIKYLFGQRGTQHPIVTQFHAIKKSDNYLKIEDLFYPVQAFTNQNEIDRDKFNSLTFFFKKIFKSNRNVQLNNRFYFGNLGEGTRPTKVVASIITSNVQYTDALTIVDENLRPLFATTINIIIDRLEKGVPVEIFEGVIITKNPNHNAFYSFITNETYLLQVI